ncbi:hypothetical protein KUTeg_012028 [Tegillarca granosa]|uniref:Uncharacterized protein n=1 Tax=Tegillarca granosa TaxID=220873 RepID=A0ABQ9EYD6_TEGGR|nr:hypothetical protein KUTeg_012028 [Tegillarca granosa]
MKPVILNTVKCFDIFLILCFVNLVFIFKDILPEGLTKIIIECPTFCSLEIHCFDLLIFKKEIENDYLPLVLYHRTDKKITVMFILYLINI